MEVTLELAFGELKDICDQWRTLGCNLKVNPRILQVIEAQHGRNIEHCLKEVLKNWLSDGREHSWNLLCTALEGPGLLEKAKQIRAKYIAVEGNPTTPAQSSGLEPTSSLPQKNNHRSAILMNDTKGELLTPALLGKWVTRSEVKVSKGEMLDLANPKEQSEDTETYHVRGKKTITIKCGTNDVTPLNDTQCALLMAIPNSKDRLSVIMTDDWLSWGAAVKAGDCFYIRVIMKKKEECCTAKACYVGPVDRDQPGIMFGVEITDPKYFGWGNSDGKCNKNRYFLCQDRNGLFLPLSSIAKQLNWLQSLWQSNLSTAECKSEAKAGSKTYCIGTRVIVRPKDGRKIKGTIRWIGELPYSSGDSKETNVPVYGIETDVIMTWRDFLPEFPPVNKHTFIQSTLSHGKVFIPISMVEPDGKIGESDAKDNSECATNIINAAYEPRRQTSVNNDQTLLGEFGPNIAGQTILEEQMRLLKAYENQKARQLNSSYLRDLYPMASALTAQRAASGVPSLNPYLSWPHRAGTLPYLPFTPTMNMLELLGAHNPPLETNPNSQTPWSRTEGSDESIPSMDMATKQRMLKCLSVTENCQVRGDIFMYTATGSEPGVVKILEPMCPMFNYFEYKIISGLMYAIGIGVGELDYPMNKMPGWSINGIGYHADDGRLFNFYENDDIYKKSGFNNGEPFGPTSTAGDRMGCGVDFDSDAGYGYVNIFFTKNGHQIGELIRMRRPINGLFPLMGLHSCGDSIRYLGHCRRVPASVTVPLGLNITTWLRSNGVKFQHDGLTVEYCGGGLQLDGIDVGIAQANLPVDHNNHYFEMEILNPGKEGSLAIGLAEPNYPLYLCPGSTKGSIAFHTGHLYKEVLPFESAVGTKFNRLGCGIQCTDSFMHRLTQAPKCKVFFTKDDTVIGIATCSIPKEGLYPFVAILASDGRVRVNFDAWITGFRTKSANIREVSTNEPNTTKARGHTTTGTNGSGQGDQEMDHVKRELDEMKDELKDLQEYSKYTSSCVVPSNQVTLLDKLLGKGAWGYVKEGKFRGQKVAVKCIHAAIAGTGTMERVQREIICMAQVRHPNLVLFIAAVLDGQEGPMIITEMLDTTLRKAYEDNLLKPGLNQCMDIFCDVASALCYLHELETPIIHRDVSSSNVLLQALANDKWKAKLSDFGSANWALKAATLGEGTLVYTAPEAYPVHPSLHHTAPLQTTKIDVYSYGILVCEVVVRKFPEPNDFTKMKDLLKCKHSYLHILVQKCTNSDPELRPTMATILKELLPGVISKP